jgi:hypothetical protein
MPLHFIAFPVAWKPISPLVPTKPTERNIRRVAMTPVAVQISTKTVLVNVINKGCENDVGYEQ